jgi:RNA polymerase sigma factor (TIGR02999 family)
MDSAAGQVTQLLRELRRGNAEAQSRLIEVVYEELHRMAQRYMRRERSDHTLQPTALVNEVYMRLASQSAGPFENRSHFFAVAAQVMRRILVDYARAAHSSKRGGGAHKITLDDALIYSDNESLEMLAIDRALTRLEELDPRQARIVELRFFVGMTEEEIAEVLEISARTVKRDWQVARAWLYAELRGATALKA